MALRDQLRVLVVDDMSTSRGLIVQALDTFGVSHVTTAADAKAALVSLAQSPAHIVISDYNMPGSSGLDLLQALRGAQTTQSIGFILITGKADVEIIERGRTLGMNNYVKKPFEPSQLRHAIEAVVGRL